MRFGVGLFALQSSAMQPTHWATAHADLIEYARLLEASGYEELWLSEHHFFYDGFCPAPLTAAASVLAATRRLRVGTGVLLLALQDPVRLAAVACDLSERSGGRLDLGVGLGFREIEFRGHGISRQERLSRYLHGLDVLEQAEAAGGARVWIGSNAPAGAARAERNHPVLFSGLTSVAICRELVSADREGWERAGRPGAWPGFAAYRNVWAGDDALEIAAALDWVRASYVQYAGSASRSPRGTVPRWTSRSTPTPRSTSPSRPRSGAGLPRWCLAFARLALLGARQVAFRLVLDGAPKAAIRSQIRGCLPTCCRSSERRASHEDWARVAGSARGRDGGDRRGSRLVRSRSGCTILTCRQTLPPSRSRPRGAYHGDRRIRLGAAHPVTVAEELSVIDNTSNGRLAVLAALDEDDRAGSLEELDVLRASLACRPMTGLPQRFRALRPTVNGGPERPFMVTPKPTQLQTSCLACWPRRAPRRTASVGSLCGADPAECDRRLLVQPAIDRSLERSSRTGSERSPGLLRARPISSLSFRHSAAEARPSDALPIRDTGGRDARLPRLMSDARLPLPWPGEPASDP